MSEYEANLDLNAYMDRKCLQDNDLEGYYRHLAGPGPLECQIGPGGTLGRSQKVAAAEPNVRTPHR